MGVPCIRACAAAFISDTHLEMIRKSAHLPMGRVVMAYLMGAWCMRFVFWMFADQE